MWALTTTIYVWARNFEVSISMDPALLSDCSMSWSSSPAGPKLSLSYIQSQSEDGYFSVLVSFNIALQSSYLHQVKLRVNNG